jgi:hypothetical protein
VPRNVVDRFLSRLSHPQARMVVMAGGAISGLLWLPLLSVYLEWHLFLSRCQTMATFRFRDSGLSWEVAEDLVSRRNDACSPRFHHWLRTGSGDETAEENAIEAYAECVGAPPARADERGGF